MEREAENDVLRKTKGRFHVLFSLLVIAMVCFAGIIIYLERQDQQLLTADNGPMGSQTETAIMSGDSVSKPQIEPIVSRSYASSRPGSEHDGSMTMVRPFNASDLVVREAVSDPFVNESEQDPTVGPVKKKRSKAEKALRAQAVRDFRDLQMKDENGEIPIDGLEKAQEQLKVMKEEGERRAIAAGKPKGLPVAGIEPQDWAWMGPGNIGGRIRTIVIHPTNPNKMWVGSVGGGIWRTENAGTTWFPVDDMMANLAVSTMVINPVNPSIMYAGTGEGFGNTDALRGDGIFKSTDGGVTWNRLAQTRVADPTVCPAGSPCPWLFVNRLAISPDGSTLLAATGSGVHRSTDDGLTWTRVTPSLTRAYFDVDFDPTNSQLAVAGSNDIAIYTSDGGQTWLTAGTSPGLGGSNRVELAYAPSSPNIVYASVDRSSGEVFQSTDGGQTFTLVNIGTMMLGAQGSYDNIIWVNPQDPTFVIVGGIDLWKSNDSGMNFVQISRWQNAPVTSAHADHHMIVAHPAFNNTTNKTVYFGNDGGIYRSNDVSTLAQTSGWTNLNNGLGITQFYGAASNYTGAIIGGSQDNGNLKGDGVVTNGWAGVVNAGGDGGFVAADQQDANYVYTEYIRLTIQRSTNGGASATEVYCNPVGNGGPCTTSGILDAGIAGRANFIAPFILDPNDANRMLAGGISLWRSNNVKAAGLPTWTVAKPTASPRPPAPGGTPNPTPPISAIAVTQGNSDIVVVGHNDGQIFLSQNGTAAVPTWSNIDSGTPMRFVTRIAIDETRIPQRIYVTYGGFSPDNVWRSDDLGVTWTDATGAGATGLPDVPVRSIVVNPFRPSVIYVGTEVGLFASEDAGATWLLPHDGPANVSVDEIFYSNGKISAATHGRGIYRVQSGGYSSPRCVQPTNVCQCAGEWNCGCSWPSGFRPDSTTDVVVSCPMTVGTIPGAAVAKSIRISSDLRVFSGGLTVFEDFVNSGVVQGNGQFLTARNFTTTNQLVFGTVDVTGNMTIGGTMLVTDLIESSRNISADANTVLSANRINALGDFYYGSQHTLSLGTDLTIGGNFFSFGKVQGRNLSQVNHFSGQPFSRTYSGPGVLKFKGSGSGFGLTLANDKTFEMETFHVSGPLNLGTSSIEVTDNISFTGTGAVSGTGTISLTPRTGVNATFSYLNASFTPTVKLRSGTYVITGANNLIGAPLIVDAGATVALNSSSITVNNNVTLNGTLTTTGLSSSTSQFFFNGANFVNNGVIRNDANQSFWVYLYGSSPTFPQTISGAGTWGQRIFQIGNSTISTNVIFANDITFDGPTLQIASSGTLGGVLNLNGNTFTHTGTGVSVGATSVNNGLFKIQPAGGVYGIGASFGTAGVRIASGTVTAPGNVFVGGPLTIDSGATLSIGSTFVGSNSDVTNNGTLTGVANSSFLARGTNFVNNGTVQTSVTFAPALSTPIVQNVGGTGIWSGTNTRFFVGRFSTVNLLNDITYGGTNVFLEGPGVRMNTGTFTFSVPCSVVWQNTGEINGNIRQTDLAACPGATLTFGNPFTSIRFTSGTPPTDVRVETNVWAPVGFINAVRRHYLITPTGGSGYAATLRLRYLDSELNGNNESTLQLWRDSGSMWTAQGATTRNSTDNWVEYAGVTQFSPWAISSALVPTSSNVAVSGRIVTADGIGIRNVSVSMTDQNGNVRTALTSSLGYYRFDDITVGQTVVLSIASKRYAFANPSRIVSVQEDIANVDFTAEP